LSNGAASWSRWNRNPDRELGKLPRTAPYGLIPQLRARTDRPWLSVNDHCRPTLRAHRGHGRQGRPDLKPGGDGHQLGRRVRPVLGDYLLAGKPPQTAAQQWSGGFEPLSGSCSSRGRRPLGAATCSFGLPVVTVRAEYQVAGVLRTHRGPWGFWCRLDCGRLAFALQLGLCSGIWRSVQVGFQAMTIACQQPGR
jgi:hypothetical protein